MADGKKELKISKAYSLDPSMVKWLEQFSARLTIVTQERVSASELVQDALETYRLLHEDAEARVKIGKTPSPTLPQKMGKGEVRKAVAG